jgi:hypothetical protein
MTDWTGAFDDQDGQPHGHLAPDRWYRPRDVVLVGDQLVPVDLLDGPADPPEPGAAMLRGFAELAEATDAEILAFARRWGMLTLCNHGAGEYHGPFDPEGSWDWGPRGFVGACAAPAQGLRTKGVELSADGERHLWQAEPLSSWRGYAGDFARAIQLILVSAPASRAQWEALGEPDEYTGDRFGGVIKWHNECGALVQRLQRDAGAVPSIVWDEPADGSTPKPRVALGRGTLLAGLAVQLLYLAAGGGREIVKCSGCGAWYAPRRRPSAGQSQTWCPTCRADGSAAAHYQALKRKRDRADPDRPRLERGRRVTALARD